MRRLLTIIGAALLIVSCKTAKYIPVETIKTEYKTTIEQLHDTTIIKDSVWVKEKGDTIFIDRWHTRDRVVLTNRVDSFIRIDTIPQITEVQVPVRQRNGYDRFTSLGFWILLLLVGGAIGWKIFRKVYLHM